MISALRRRSRRRGQVRFQRPAPPSQARLFFIAMLVAAVVTAVSWLAFRWLAAREREQPDERPPASRRQPVGQ